MPIPKAREVKLSEAERRGLEKLVKRYQVGQQIAMRARIVLAAGEGEKTHKIAERYGVSIDMVRLWRNRWIKLQDLCLEDLSLEDRLQDVPRPGAPARISADQRCRIEALACEKPEDSGRPITHWSSREIADELKKREIVEDISPRHAARLLKRGRPEAPFESVLANS